MGRDNGPIALVLGSKGGPPISLIQIQTAHRLAKPQKCMRERLVLFIHSKLILSVEPPMAPKTLRLHETGVEKA